MRLLVLLCIATLTFALQCPSKLPVTCNCKCYFCAHKYGSISINCSIVPDLYDLLSVLENGTFFEVKIDKCKKPVQNLTKLPSFYTICLLINNCGLEHVVDDAFADIADLELLDLSYNALTKMPVFPKFPMLTYVALNNNLIRDFGEPSSDYFNGSFDGVPYLTDLYLQNNCLTKITNITFANLKTLRNLDLSFNNLRSIAVDAFQNQHGIIDFNLSFNELTYLEPGTFKAMDIYTNLYLNNNRLTRLSANTFDGNNKILFIELQYNQLTEISPNVFDNLDSLSTVDLSNNNLTSIDRIFGTLPRLRIVDLSNNNITKITNTTFNKFWELYLDFSNNQIESVAPNAFQDVRKLTLDDNKLSTLDGVFGKDNCLRDLYLSNNSFTQIKNTTFYYLTKLEYLILSNNEISYIEPYSFATTDLFSLHISNNNLTTLEPYSVFVEKRPPRYLRYDGNPFVCDEKLEWFTDYLKNQIPNDRWYGKRRADEVYSDPVICPNPLVTTTEKSVNKTCNCKC